MECTSSSSSHGSPEQPQYYIHEHPLLDYELWIEDQKRLQRTALLRKDYIVCMTEHSIRSDLFQPLRDKNCDCYVFRKVGKCLHVLNFVEAAELQRIMESQIDCPIRSMLSFPTDITSVLEETRLIGQNEDSGCLSNFKTCNKCKGIINIILPTHKCSPEMVGTECSWRYKLPFNCNNLKTYLNGDTIMLGPDELHLLIPYASRIYDKLNALCIRTSLIQIIAQDPQYQKTLSILESRNMVEKCFTYHLYLYITHRLLPYIETLKYTAVKKKIIPIFTVIRSEDHEASKDVIGFNEEEEIDKRFACCPNRYKKKVQGLLTEMSEQFDDEGRLVEEYMKNIIQDGFSTSFKTEWCYVLKCLDVKRPVYKGIRRYINQIRNEDGDTWSTRMDFIHGRQSTDIGMKLTNIFGVIPQHRISGNLLKRALLLSREKYSYNQTLTDTAIELDRVLEINMI